MKLTIEKFKYSSNPWRLVTDDGLEVCRKEIFDHPDIGPTPINMPIRGNTKRECVEKALDLLGDCLDERIQRMQRRQAANEDTA